MNNNSFNLTTTKQAFTTTTLSSYQVAVNTFLNNFIDFCTTYIVPIICTYGIIANIINFIVFSRKELKDVTFKYYRINAVSNSIYLLICFFLFVARCGIYCSFSRTYPAQFYLYFFYVYFKGIFAILVICIQILVSIYRLLIVINKPIHLFENYKTFTFILLIFSAVFYSPLLFTKEISESITNVSTSLNGTIQISRQYRYSNVNNSIGNSDVGKWLIIFVITIMRGFVSLGVISSLGIATLFRLKQHIKNVEKLRGQRRKNKNRIIPSQPTKSDKSISDDNNNSINFNSNQTKISSASRLNDVYAEEKKEKIERINELRSRRLTMMVASIGILFSIGNIPNCVVYVYQQYVDTNGIFYRTFSITANMFLFFAQGSDILIYYMFNHQYKRAFKHLFNLA